MTHSSSYPADDATRAVTGCSEVIFEIEKAAEGRVRADSSPAAAMSPYPRSPHHEGDRICPTPTPDSGRRRTLRFWLKRVAGKRN